MSMGYDDRLEIIALIGEKADIRQHEIDAGKIETREGHTAIDHDPLALAGCSVAVEGEIHTDFANTAQRQKHQFFLLGHNILIPFLRRIHTRRRSAKPRPRRCRASGSPFYLCRRTGPSAPCRAGCSESVCTYRLQSPPSSAHSQ